MSLPLWDDIELPPDFTLVDINGLQPEGVRVEMQARALELWIDELGGDPADFAVRSWDDTEGIFAVKDADGDIVGIQVMLDVEDG